MLVTAEQQQDKREKIRTSNAGEELPSKVLNLAIGKRHKAVALEEIEDTLTEQIHHYTDMSAVVKAFIEVDASVPVGRIVGLERSKNT